MCLGLLKAVTGSYVPRVVEGGDRGFRVGRFPRFEASNTLLESHSRRFFVIIVVQKEQSYRTQKFVAFTLYTCVCRLGLVLWFVHSETRSLS